MKRDYILKLSHDAGFKWPEVSITTIEERLERFAALVAQHEREQCALVAEQLRPSKPEYDQRFYDGCTVTAMAIRARCEK